jgi:hypothetical protein
LSSVTALEDGLYLHLQLVTGLHAWLELGLALEAEDRADGVVVHDIDVGLVAIVPEQQALRDVAVDLQANDAVALAGGGGLKLGDAFFKIAAAAAAEIGGLRRQDGSRAEQRAGECDRPITIDH